MSDKPRESFLVPEPVAYCYETPLHGWEIASRAAAAAEPELRWRAMVMITDAEREALARICEAADDIIDEDKRANGVYWQDDAAAVAVVRGLLERLGGGR